MKDGMEKLLLQDPRVIFVLETELRARFCLHDNKIETISDITKYNEAELLRIPNLGRKSLNEIKRLLNRFNLSLKGYEEDTIEQQITAAMKRADAAKEIYRNAISEVKRLSLLINSIPDNIED